jgi:outer membrane protein TolC
MKTITHRLTLTAAILIGLGTRAFAQQDTAKAFSLKEAVEFAKQNNYSLQNALLDEQSAKQKVKETTAIGLPQVNANLGFNNNFQLQPFYFGFGDPIRAGAKITGNGGISANQLIFDGSYIVGLQASKEYVKLSKQVSQKTEQEIEIAVAKAYYLVLIAEENMSLLESNLRQLEKTLNDTRALNKNGFAEKTDVDRLELAVSNLKLQKEKLSDQRELAFKLLKLQMGMNVNQDIKLTDNLEKLFTSGIQLNEKGTATAANRIEYQLLNQQVRLNELNKKRYKAGYLPSLSAIYNYNLSSFRDGSFRPLTPDGWYTSSFLGLSINMPIFDGFRKQTLIAQSRIDLKKLDNDKKNLENAITMETFQAQTNYETAIKQIDIRKGNMKLAEEIYKSVNLKYKNGVGSAFELTQAETDLKAAQVNYLTAVYELLVAKIELNKALGKTIIQ